MKLWNRKTQAALGIHIDGEQVRIAHLVRQGERVVLAGLNSSTLKTRLDVEGDGGSPKEEREEDILGLDGGLAEGTGGTEAVEEDGGAVGNMEVLYQLLDAFPAKDCSLAFSLLETRVFFTDHAADAPAAEHNRKKLKQRLLEEAARDWGENAPDAAPLEERHDYFRAGDRLVSVVHEDPLEMLGLLDRLKPFIGDVRIGLVEPVELTLMNLARRCLEKTPGVTALVYTGEDYSRVVFMRDGEYLALSQPIYEGAKAEGIAQTLCSRLRYERDMADLPEIERIVLAGQCRSAEAQTFIGEQFPDSRIEVLRLEGLGFDGDEETGELVPNFAVAVGLAWKALQPKNPAFYPINFLPETRRRLQNPLELAWHGVGLLSVVLAVGLLAGVEARDRGRQIDFERLENELLTAQVAEGRQMALRVDELQGQIVAYERYFSLADSLEGQRLALSDRVRRVAEEVRRTDSLWLEGLRTEESRTNVRNATTDRYILPPQTFFLNGYSLYRNRVASLAGAFDGEQVRSMVRNLIRERTVYAFDIEAPLAESVDQGGPR